VSETSRESVEPNASSSVGLRRAARRFGWVAVIVVAIVLPLAMRAGWEGRAELSRAQAAASEGDVDRQIVHLGRAARWRVPGLAHDAQALERLVALGAAAEAVGPEALEQSLAAYREVRGALLSTRTWGVPRRELFDDMNDRIARLMARQEAELGTDVSGTGDPYTYHLELLQAVPGPHPVRGNLAALAFLGWLLTSAGFILRGLDARGRIRPRPALRWGGASVILLVTWAVLLRFA
jgi:hypothetical protein